MNVLFHTEEILTIFFFIMLLHIKKKKINYTKLIFFIWE